MVATISAGTTATYYISQSRYYLGGQEPRGRWIAIGEGIELSGDGLEVVDRDFELLHAGLNTNGKPLVTNDGGRLDHVGGYDMTFSAPKSMSVLYALADESLRTKLEEIQADAVDEAFTILNQEAAFYRRGKGGHLIERTCLMAAGFQHSDARPALHEDGSVFADCALHTHLVILNLAQRDDATYSRLDGRQLFAWKMACGAVYHHRLYIGLWMSGFKIEVTGTNGIFEIAGVPADLCRYFSARRHEIEDEMAAVGLKTHQAPALAAAKALTTRRGKETEQTLDRHALWREKAASLGFEPQQIVEQALENQDFYIPIPDRIVTETVNNVLHDLTARESTFGRRHLYASVASAMVGMVTSRTVEEEIERLEAEGLALGVGRDLWAHPIYSTPEMILLEQDLFDRAQRLALAEVHAPRSEGLDNYCRHAGLNEEQEQAARLACSSKGIVIVEGAPGVGKTTLLAPATKAWQDAGWRVIGASTAWKIAHQLRDDLGIEAKAIDSWLVGAENGKPFLVDRTLLVIDEAGLLTSRQMSRILENVETARMAGHEVAVRMVGDRKQLQPIGGPGLNIVSQAIGTQRVDTIVRQHEAWLRDVVTAFGDGKALPALEKLYEQGCLHGCTGPVATLKTLVDAWDIYRRAEPLGTALLIAKTNKQVLALNHAVRERLRSEGVLASDDAIILDAVNPSGTDHKLALAAGDRVRFMSRNDALGIINGTLGEVVSVEETGDDRTHIKVRLGDCTIGFSPGDIADEKGRLQMVHAYATTCYGSQGLTTDRAFILTDVTMDRHDIHVAVSRSRYRADLFIDEKALETRAKAARLLSNRERAVESKERLETLANALGRSGMKRSTLDFLKTSSSQSFARILNENAPVVTTVPLSELPPMQAQEQKPEHNKLRQRNRGLSLE
ncbi:MobF family relaxase [Fulvimarina sp. 2208YS6-2-32]|uniref:MobF family relaxase n=1 Tax=Fulvimarina uroteuthidis TaxID=3098149 RepID=A0ABU5I773_9HYPH|nr:MobF family relaxase [Fulvimarina sp. 2208YS6-2-32]MDY8111086.1 MobF family relaxase [Fulvimarina sp. 2208YS6-2-32]